MAGILHNQRSKQLYSVQDKIIMWKSMQKTFEKKNVAINGGQIFTIESHIAKKELFHLVSSVWCLTGWVFISAGRMIWNGPDFSCPCLWLHCPSTQWRSTLQRPARYHKRSAEGTSVSSAGVDGSGSSCRWQSYVKTQILKWVHYMRTPRAEHCEDILALPVG